jgi:hypothetical protein
MTAAADGPPERFVMSFMHYVLALLSLASWASADAEQPPVPSSDVGCAIDPLGGCRG